MFAGSIALLSVYGFGWMVYVLTGSSISYMLSLDLGTPTGAGTAIGCTLLFAYMIRLIFYPEGEPAYPKERK